MKSTSETGHNKNTANFTTAYQILQEMGSLYNPSNTNIQLTYLNTIQTGLAEITALFNEKKPSYTNAVANRETEIAPLSKLITKALNFALSTNMTATDKENLTSLAIKLRGFQKPKTANSISTSQMSYDSRLANLAAFISQLASHPQYQPNETEIQIESLKNYHQQLTHLSNLVNAAGNKLITIKKDRDALLYHNETSVIQLIREIKFYLKALGTEGKPYYRALTALQFKNIRR